MHYSLYIQWNIFYWTLYWEWVTLNLWLTLKMMGLLGTDGLYSCKLSTPLRPSDVVALVQHWITQYHNLNQCWLIVNWTLRWEGLWVGGAVKFVVMGSMSMEEKTTTGPALGGAVFDLAQILAYLVHNMSTSQLYMGFCRFSCLSLTIFRQIYG